MTDSTSKALTSEQMAKEDIATLTSIGTVLLVLFCVGVALYTVIALTCVQG